MRQAVVQMKPRIVKLAQSLGYRQEAGLERSKSLIPMISSILKRNSIKQISWFGLNNQMGKKKKVSNSADNIKQTKVQCREDASF